MGMFDFLKRSPAPAAETPKPAPRQSLVVGANNDALDARTNKDINTSAFTNKNITYQGEITGYNYDRILRDKQGHIFDLFQLADYYADEDPITHGIIFHVYLPYTVGSPWELYDANEKTIAIYEKWYEKIRLRERLESIALQYWKYSNVYTYVREGVPTTLPVNKCRIGGISLNGTPIVDFDCTSMKNEWKPKTYEARENGVDDHTWEEYSKGYPPEIVQALTERKDYAQMNPKYMRVLQAPKEDWLRYSIPFIASCLEALAKKKLISSYETAILNLAAHSFVHGAYGDKEMYPNDEDMMRVGSITKNAMCGFPAAITDYLLKYTVVQPKLDDLFQYDKYRDVNRDILSAGGISGILVNGISEDGSTFASAQVSMSTAAERIDAARREIEELMNQVNVCIQERLREDHIYNVNEVPKFRFKPLDMSGQKALREACLELWKQGVVSTKTMMEAHGYNMDEEKRLRDIEAKEGYDEAFVPHGSVAAQLPQENNTGGRPTMDDDERQSDPEASVRGRQPKPSNPDGSTPEQE